MRVIDPRFDEWSPQQRRHLRRRVLLHRWQRVSVDVVRDVGLCVAEPLRNDLHGNASVERERHAGMREPVEFDAPHAHFLYHSQALSYGSIFPSRVTTASTDRME